jgi:hypothetical protein
MEEAAFLIQAFVERMPQMPFALQDHHELWLFDQAENLPIALLATTRHKNDIPSSEPRYWSASAGSNGVPSQRRFPDAENLEKQVKQYAGFNIRKHWITRQPDGSGIIDRLQTQMAKNRFPPFLLTEQWPDESQRQLAGAFIEWTAPALLTLQHLGSNERQRLEKSLNIQSRSIEHHWKLYPEMIDEQHIKTARVQCRLQQSASQGSNR